MAGDIHVWAIIEIMECIKYVYFGIIFKGNITETMLEVMIFLVIKIIIN